MKPQSYKHNILWDPLFLDVCYLSAAKLPMSALPHPAKSIGSLYSPFSIQVTLVGRPHISSWMQIYRP